MRVQDRSSVFAFRDYVEVLRWLRRTEQISGTVFITEVSGHCAVWPVSALREDRVPPIRQFLESVGARAYLLPEFLQVKFAWETA